MGGHSGTLSYLKTPLTGLKAQPMSGSGFWGDDLRPMTAVPTAGGNPHTARSHRGMEIGVSTRSLASGLGQGAGARVRGWWASVAPAECT